MKLFLDSAILSEIEAVYAAGVCDGITMNPSLVKQAVDKLKAKGEKVSLESYIKKALKIRSPLHGAHAGWSFSSSRLKVRLL